MEGTVFSTHEIPQQDRFEYWQHCVSNTHAPILLSTDDRQNFQAYQRTFDINGIRAWPSLFKPVTFKRSQRLIRQSDPEYFHLSFVFLGRLEGVSGRKNVAVDMGEINVLDTSTPFEVAAARGFSEQRGIGLEIPRRNVNVPARAANSLVGEKLCANSGYGALITQFLNTLISDSAGFSDRDQCRISGVLSDLVSGLFAKALAAEDLLPVETRKSALLMEVKRFVCARLSDPDLTIQEIADAHFISVRYLHHIFRGEELTVGSWIRRKRLEGTRDDLLNPELADVPISRVAQRWGFKSSSSFSRAFRDYFGASPVDMRG